MKRFLALVGFIAVFPFFVSRRSRVVRSIWVNAKPAEVFPLINNLKLWSQWTAWSRREAAEELYEGPEAGEGALQHWKTERMEGTIRIIQSVPDQRVAYDLNMENGRHHMEGVLTLEPVGEGTRIVWACWWIGIENPYARYMDLAMRWWIRRDFEAGLENLKQIAEQPARV